MTRIQTNFNNLAHYLYKTQPLFPSTPHEVGQVIEMNAGYPNTFHSLFISQINPDPQRFAGIDMATIDNL